jgi:hypothetical protein
MTAITYRNTKTALPGWVNTVHLKEARGYSYEADTHFVHLYGKESGLWIISVGLTATEKKGGGLDDWAIRVFGAEDIKPTIHPVGSTVSGVWRPGIYFNNEALQGLGNSQWDLRSSEQALRLLVERLDELLLYIEPDAHGLSAYSHKTRELLLLACTELENSWKYYMSLACASPIGGGDFTTKDYVKLLKPLFLSEFEITMRPYSGVPTMKPFDGWDSNSPTKSLGWYDAYNKTKHDRTTHFAEAKLSNCLAAVAANLIMFRVRFSPFPLLEGPGTLAPLVNQLFNIQLHNPNPQTFYVPLVQLPSNVTESLICGNTNELVQPWTRLPLQL